MAKIGCSIRRFPVRAHGTNTVVSALVLPRFTTLPTVTRLASPNGVTTVVRPMTWGFPQLRYSRSSSPPSSFCASLAPRQSRTVSSSAPAHIMETVDTTERLSRLRELMRAEGIDIYIVPSEDSHQSEYIAPCDARRAFISGFNGSAGTAAVTLSAAVLGTDGRYFNQAEKQLDSNWELLKLGMQGVPSLPEWILKQVEQGQKVIGVDPGLITNDAATRLVEKIQSKGGVLKAVDKNLVDQVWDHARPSRPLNQVDILDIQFAGVAFPDKLSKLRKEIGNQNSYAFILTALDEIAWLFNLRGSDIPYNPVFFSYAVVTLDSCSLYIDETRLGGKLREYLGDHVQIKPYEGLFDDLTAMSAVSSSQEAPRKFLVSSQASWKLVESLGGKQRVTAVTSPVAIFKAIKNKTELDGMRACHARDGAALIRFFAWLENELTVKKSTIDEVGAADKLEQLRAEGQYFKGLSFDTISSTGPNAAVIHYSPIRDSCSIIDPSQIYLCDSGAQYLDGTTDTTRTLHFGSPTEMERKAYSLVLKGHIALDRARFPRGTNGASLDVLARQHLWRYGLNYRHGTGHGVGSYLNVHEGPIGIGTRSQYSQTSLTEGHVLSNEPGYYEDGSFGIRIENVVLVQPVSTDHNFGGDPYYGFEHVTMVPMSRSLINPNLLSVEEKEWLNAYHALVVDKTKDLLKDDILAQRWLAKETEPFHIAETEGMSENLKKVNISTPH